MQGCYNDYNTLDTLPDLTMVLKAVFNECIVKVSIWFNQFSNFNTKVSIFKVRIAMLKKAIANFSAPNKHLQPKS